MNEKQIALARALAAFDTIVIACREQQLSLAKILADDLGADRVTLLKSLKDTSLELLEQNGLEY